MEAIIPTDTNAVSFVGISRDAATSNAVLTLYAPTALPVDVFARERLDSGDWSLCASTNALHPFTELTIPSLTASRFFAASRGDVDLDGDGYDDDEELAYDSDPMAFTPGANATIRYYFDDDDHLTATYSGARQGFDQPQMIVPTYIGPRHTGVIPTSTPLDIKDLHPLFIKKGW